MAPSNRAAAAKAIALRMKAVQMKRTSSKDAGPSTTPKALSPKKRVVSAKKKEVSPKKKVVQTKKKTRSPKKKTKAVSEKSVSKTKSGNSSKSNKIEDGDDEEDPNATGGLKLLRRGMVTMNRITRRLIRGRKLTIQINDKGEPYGKAAKEMQSYIGVLARTKISIVTGDWREVDPEEKQKIWESIMDAYVIPKECKKLVITSAANKWREFKSKLTNKYIIPYMDTPELLENPPDDYRCVKKADWDIFVADRISAKFQELRDAQIEKRKENRYPHRMARKGYANLEAELVSFWMILIELCE
ncbi:uncharacterized protein LOC133730667 [Rosa rugosa]|uniref:uncharacterized protein LOC133730667 n=1 Tax=Rosa rugosa TaxID=74645 RepID=UPI002B406F35|nr:uncharacterized protein LOC133730667 [Rosa rugosa]